MKQLSLLGEIKHTFVSIAKGLKITFLNFFRKKVTVMYPEEKIETAPAYRGLVSLPVDPATGADICIGCGACARMCPEQVITVTTEVDENKKRKVVDFKVDFSRCMWCGLCTEVCPKNTLLMSNFYEAATTSRSGMVYDRALLNKIGGMIQSEDGPEGEADGEKTETKKDAE
jgi:NADH-quinone oxidoreductase subunit I